MCAVVADHNCRSSSSNGGKQDDEAEGEDEVEEDADMEDAATAAAEAMAQKIKAPTDPDDLSAYNLDDYDEEESKGAGESPCTLL